MATALASRRCSCPVLTAEERWSSLKRSGRISGSVDVNDPNLVLLLSTAFIAYILTRKACLRPLPSRPRHQIMRIRGHCWMSVDGCALHLDDVDASVAACRRLGTNSEARFAFRLSRGLCFQRWVVHLAQIFGAVLVGITRHAGDAFQKRSLYPLDTTAGSVG